MSDFIIKNMVRTLFFFTSKKRAADQTKDMIEKYSRLADNLSQDLGQRPIEVPPMRGVDEDMRRWSFYMILEHNTIVNKAISETIRQLCCGESLSGAAAIDMKRDVMPSTSASEEQLPLFRESVLEHLKTIQEIRQLKGTKTAPHVIFGEFDAHKWNCMFPFHLMLHYKQAKHVVSVLSSC